jgi:membrane protease YdiL (CAAX protease family)
LGNLGNYGTQSATSGHIYPCVAHLTPAPLVQIFWRSFFLASMTRVLPLPACVALSSTVFAAIHYAPGNLLPIFLLSGLCDTLYLRTSSLAAPLVLHAAWNAYQLVGICLGKDSFV